MTISVTKNQMNITKAVMATQQINKTARNVMTSRQWMNLASPRECTKVSNLLQVLEIGKTFGC